MLISNPGRKPLHVAVVNNLYPPIMAGGAELIVSFLCEALAARGCRVTVISTCGPEQEPMPVEHRNGVEVIRFFPPNVYWSFARAEQPRHRKALWHLRDAWNNAAGKRVQAILRDAPPDLLHTHVLDGFSASVWRQAKRLGIPVLHTAHDYHLLCPRAFLLTRDWKLCTVPSPTCRIYRGWHMRTTRYVDMFTSPSQFLLDYHRARGLRAGAGTVVHNGIPLPEGAVFAKATRQKGIVTRFLLMCRLTPEKGVRVVLQAMARLPHDAPIELVVAGRGELEDEVRAAVAADPRITFHGFVTGDAKEKLLVDADYMLLPSLWYENAPVTMVEAAAYGLGLIGSRIGGIPEFMEEGNTGLLCEPGDVDDLARAMNGVATGSLTLNNFDARSAALAARFSVDAMTDAYLEHYRKLVRVDA